MRATLPSAVTTPNCPKPEANEAMTAPHTTREFHLCRRGAGSDVGSGDDGHQRVLIDALIGRTANCSRRRVTQNGL